MGLPVTDLTALATACMMPWLPAAPAPPAPAAGRAPPPPPPPGCAAVAPGFDSGAAPRTAVVFRIASIICRSSTVRAIAPGVSRVMLWCSRPLVSYRSKLGRKPHTPQRLEGMRKQPPATDSTREARCGNACGAEVRGTHNAQRGPRQRNRYEVRGTDPPPYASLPAL